MNKELQQAVRVKRLPEQRQGQLQHLAGGAKRRVVLESGTRQANALEGVIEHDAVATGDDDGVALRVAVRLLAHNLRDRLRSYVPR